MVRPGYTRTEVGEVPEDWNTSLVGSLCTISSGTTPARALSDRYFRNGSTRWVKTLDLNNGRIRSTEECVTDTALEETSLRVYPIGTVLVAMYGGFEQIGRTGLLEVPACVNQALSAVQPDRKRLDPAYVLHFLNHHVRYWRAVASSSRRDPNISSRDVAAFPIAHPPLPEQARISGTIDDLQTLVESLEHLLAKKRAIKQGAMQSLLTGAKRLPGFTEPWQQRTLGSIGRFLKGSGVTRDQANSGHLPCIRYGEIYTHHTDVVQQFFSRITREVAASALRLQQGDLLFAGSGETKEEIGKCVAFVHDVEAYAGGDIVVLRPSWGNATFLGYFLNTQPVMRQKASRGQGDAVVHISSRALAEVTGSFPQPEEQAAIAEVLADLDADLDATSAKLDKARAIKQGMMQELLTGRIRLV